MSTIAITSSETKRTSLSTMGQALKITTTLTNVGLIAVGALNAADPEQRAGEGWRLAALGMAGLSAQITVLVASRLGAIDTARCAWSQLTERTFLTALAVSGVVVGAAQLGIQDAIGFKPNINRFDNANLVGMTLGTVSAFITGLRFKKTRSDN